MAGRRITETCGWESLDGCKRPITHIPVCRFTVNPGYGLRWMFCPHSVKAFLSLSDVLTQQEPGGGQPND